MADFTRQDLGADLSTDPGHLLQFAVSEMAATSAACIVGLRHWHPVLASMVVIVGAIAAAGLLDLKSLGGAEVGAVQRPAFQLSLPELPLATWLQSGELAFGLAAR